MRRHGGMARHSVAPAQMRYPRARSGTTYRCRTSSGGARASISGAVSPMRRSSRTSSVADHGLVVDALPRDVRLVYVTPSHQYPLGVAMSLPRRLALLAWAERHDAAIVEDDYDSEFRFAGRPIEPLQMLDRAGRVIYVGSFSKTMLPTLRLGFILTPASLRDAMHRAKFVCDWHTSQLAQATLARFIDDGWFARHIRKMSNLYRARRDVIADTL